MVGAGDPAPVGLRGNFNQLRKLKVKYPKLKILISIGGWTYSKYFSDADDPYPFHFSVENAVNAYLEAGVNLRKLTIGIACYGRGWQGVADGGKGGQWQAANGAVSPARCRP